MRCRNLLSFAFFNLVSLDPLFHPHSTHPIHQRTLESAESTLKLSGLSLSFAISTMMLDPRSQGMIPAQVIVGLDERNWGGMFGVLKGRELEQRIVIMKGGFVNWDLGDEMSC